MFTFTIKSGMQARAAMHDPSAKTDPTSGIFRTHSGGGERENDVVVVLG
jgi:hypothetical protein